MLLAVIGIVLMIAISSFLVFTLWHQSGQSRHKIYNMSISKCKGAQTGMQYSEGNATANNTKLICK
jgi:hypothetical protein